MTLAQSDDGVPPVQISAGDDESDVSDSEEGYCDETLSSPLISMRLVPVRKRRFKELFTNKEKVYYLKKIIYCKTFATTWRVYHK